MLILDCCILVYFEVAESKKRKRNDNRDFIENIKAFEV